MLDKRTWLRGRGTPNNPPNRFELLSYSPDPEAQEDTPQPATQLLRDPARTILSYNDSPDVGFTVSLNPYRGCEHGCIYCLSGDTLVLMADGTTRRLKDVRIGDAIYGTIRRGWYRCYVKTRVLAHWSVTKPAYRVTLEDGTCLITGEDHRFLTERGWKFATGAEQGDRRRPHLTTNNKLMGTGAFAQPPQKSRDYQRGYLCGLIRGDGFLKFYRYEREGRSHGNQYQFRLALTDEEALRRAALYLLEFGVPTHDFLFQEAFTGRKAMLGIRACARARVERVEEIVAWPPTLSDNWCKGFLAGIFDAEGSYSDGILRISNTDQTIVKYTVDCLERLGFVFTIQSVIGTRIRPIQVVRLCGGLQEHLRFFHTVDTAITRKHDLEGQAVKSSANLRVASIESLGVCLPLFDITTGTGDFIANGVVSHNCYARPTHEWLGFSSGLDFETRILVKEDAPRLLNKALSSPNWQPRVIALSGVTDPYQPVERKLQLTRRCLEVLATWRNPVAMVTKNALVTRDCDLLAELAQVNAAAVFISITTLDAQLARVMEPRASAPVRRLAAISSLAQAGIPVGVMVAPIIPGLTDHEMPAIVNAAAQAGARFAGHTIVRLPYSVKDLFTQWLETHYPERKNKVLSRIRTIRQGKLNDSHWHQRMRGQGIFAESIHTLFAVACRRAGLASSGPKLSTAAFCRPDKDAQPSLFSAENEGEQGGY